MLRSIMFLMLLGSSSLCFSQDIIENLPRPHYHKLDSDPAWMKHMAQLHGHLGPMVVFGARMGMAGLKAVDAKGYFDVDVTCEGPFTNPPASCFLDGVQISTGATLGKQNLHWTKSEQIVFHIKNSRTGKTAVLRPKKQFLDLLPKPGPAIKDQADAGQKSKTDDDHSFDALSRKIAVMLENEILAITYPDDK
jgi:formylmethanofuran dehydrogenase subunit E